MKCRVFYKPDGTISVLHPAPKARILEETDIELLSRMSGKRRPRETDGELLERVAEERFPEETDTELLKRMVEARILEETDIELLSRMSGKRRLRETDGELLERVAQKAIAGTEFEGLPYDDIEPTELPPRKEREKWRGEKGNGVHVDESVVTQAEKRQTLVDKIDAELAKPEDTINTAKVMRWQQKLQKRDYETDDI